MPILAVFHSVIDKNQYEALRKEVNWETDKPAGALFHAAATDAEGHVTVADVWESDAELNNFVTTRLVPTFMKHGLTPPDVSLYSTHNINTYSGLDRFRV